MAEKSLPHTRRHFRLDPHNQLGSIAVSPGSSSGLVNHRRLDFELRTQQSVLWRSRFAMAGSAGDASDGGPGK